MHCEVAERTTATVCRPRPVCNTTLWANPLSTKRLPYSLSTLPYPAKEVHLEGEGNPITVSTAPAEGDAEGGYLLYYAMYPPRMNE